MLTVLPTTTYMYQLHRTTRYVDITPHTTIVALTREAAQAAHLLAADIAVLTAGELNLTVVEPPSGEASAIQHPHGVPSVAVQGVFEQSVSATTISCMSTMNVHFGYMPYMLLNLRIRECVRNQYII